MNLVSLLQRLSRGVRGLFHLPSLRLSNSKVDAARPRIREMGRAGQLHAAAQLLHFGDQTNPEIQSAALRTLEELLVSVNGLLLPQLDMAMRSSPGFWEDWETSIEFWKITPTEVARLPDDPPGHLLLRLATMHHDGHVRLAAVQQLHPPAADEVFPFLLLRLNDWVRPIRDYARETVAAAIQSGINLISHFDLIASIEQGRRTQFEWLRASLGKEMLNPQRLPIVEEKLRSMESIIHKFCVRMLLRPELQLSEGLLRMMLKASVSALRTRAAKHLLQEARAHPEEHAVMCQNLAADPFMSVRRLALDALATQHSIAEIQPDLERALLDNHSAVRALAAHHLHMIADFDVAAWYRRVFARSSHPRLPAIIAGLGEFGVAADAPLLLPFLVSPLVRVRVATVKAIARLDGAHYADWLLALVADNTSSVSSVASRALEPMVRTLNRAELFQIALRHPTDFVRQNALRLVNRLGKWEKLPPLLAACRDQCTSVSSSAKNGVRRWLDQYNRIWVAPSAEQSVDVSNELRVSRNFLDPSLFADLSAILKAGKW